MDAQSSPKYSHPSSTERSSMIKTPIAPWLLTISLTLGALALPTMAAAQIEFSVTIAPPPVPVYEQPEIPAPGFIWVPGYWYYGPYGYYWVPGTWVEPPVAGLLWTPGYWGWSEGFFVWHGGYWGPQVGFYGGVNYGYGYPGRGYEGGYWRDNRFWYNREVNNITHVQIQNVYSKTVINNITVNRVSYAGGPGGLTVQPTAEEQRVAHEHHTPATPVQLQHRERAATRPELAASVNHGKPEVAATAKPGNFESHTVAASRAGGPVPVHARDLPKPQAPTGAPKPPSNAEADYQRQQAELQTRHQQERDALDKMQERDHAYLNQQSANAQRQAAIEHEHRQQTEFLQQRQASEMQSLRTPPPAAHAPPHAPPPPAQRAPAPPTQHAPPPPRGEPTRP
jgi:WXXGXW repeat (2 copies)